MTSFRRILVNGLVPVEIVISIFPCRRRYLRSSSCCMCPKMNGTTRFLKLPGGAVVDQTADKVRQATCYCHEAYQHYETFQKLHNNKIIVLFQKSFKKAFRILMFLPLQISKINILFKKRLKIELTFIVQVKIFVGLPTFIGRRKILMELWLLCYQVLQIGCWVDFKAFFSEAGCYMLNTAVELWQYVTLFCCCIF